MVTVFVPWAAPEILWFVSDSRLIKLEADLYYSLGLKVNKSYLISGLELTTELPLDILSGLPSFKAYRSFGTQGLEIFRESQTQIPCHIMAISNFPGSYTSASQSDF